MGSKGPRHGRVTVGSKSAYRNWWDPRSRAREFEQATRETPPPTPARKDRKRWCKGKPGVEHVPHIVTVTEQWRPASCGWGPEEVWRSAEVAWKCRHWEECATCGRVLRETRDLKRTECPQWPGTAEQRAEAEVQAATEYEKWREWQERRATRFRSRPVITGPQGYRRNREA